MVPRAPESDRTRIAPSRSCQIGSRLGVQPHGILGDVRARRRRVRLRGRLAETDDHLTLPGDRARVRTSCSPTASGGPLPRRGARAAGLPHRLHAPAPPAPSAEPQVAAESRHSSSSPYCHCDSKLTRRARPPASRAGAPGCWRCPPPAARRLSSWTRRAARSGLHEVVVAVCAQCGDAVRTGRMREATDLVVARAPGRSHAIRGSCSELGGLSLHHF